MRPSSREERERLLEGLASLASVSEHHVVANLDADLTGHLRSGEDLVDGDLLVDVAEDGRAPRLDAQTEALATGEPHLADELRGQHIDPRVATPRELEPALPHGA